MPGSWRRHRQFEIGKVVIAGRSKEPANKMKKMQCFNSLPSNDLCDDLNVDR